MFSARLGVLLTAVLVYLTGCGSSATLPPQKPTASPVVVKFYSTPLEPIPGQKTVRIANCGAGKLASPDISMGYVSRTGWLAATATQVTGEDAFDVILTATETGLGIGLFKASVTVMFEGGARIQVPVSLQVLGGWEWGFTDTTGCDLYAASGMGAADLVAVGDFGTILLRKDGVYQILPSPTQVTLRGVATWGTDIVVGGDNGTVLHYNGTSWADISPGTTSACTSIWGTALDDFWIAAGAVYHYDGSAWTQHSVNAQEVVGITYTETYARYYQTVYRFDGTTWTALPVPSGIGTGRSISALGNNRVALLGDQKIFFFNGSTWIGPCDIAQGSTSINAYCGKARMFGPSNIELIWSGTSTARCLYDVSPDWTLFTFRGLDCIKSGYLYLRSTAFLNNDTAAVVGFGSLVLVFSLPTWTAEHPANATEIQYQPMDVAVSGGWLYKVGPSSLNGFVRRWKPSTGWQPLVSGLTYELKNICAFPDGTIAAAGRNEFYVYDGTSWTRDETTPNAKLNAIVGRNITDCFVCAEDGNIYHRSAAGLAISCYCPGAIWYTASMLGDDIYSAGNLGRLVRYVSGDWVILNSGTTGTLYWACNRGSDIVFHSATPAVRVQGFDCSTFPAGGGRLFCIGGDTMSVTSSIASVVKVLDGDAWRSVCNLPLVYNPLYFEWEGEHYILTDECHMLHLIR